MCALAGSRSWSVMASIYQPGDLEAAIEHETWINNSRKKTKRLTFKAAWPKRNQLKPSFPNVLRLMHPKACITFQFRQGKWRLWNRLISLFNAAVPRPTRELKDPIYKFEYHKLPQNSMFKNDQQKKISFAFERFFRCCPNVSLVQNVTG